MNTPEFLSYLRGLDIHLYAKGDRLRCNAPKGTLTHGIRAELAKHKAEIMAYLKTVDHTIIPSTVPPISPFKQKVDIPLSLNQQRLWFLEQLEPGSPVYNIPLAFRIVGLLNIDSWEQSLKTIIRRHAILRTTFSAKDGKPNQVISNEMNFILRVIDLRKLLPENRETEIQQQIFGEARRPFDLTRGPLLRCKIFQLDEKDYVFLLIVHHIIFDVWSFDIFMRELVQLYNAISRGKPSPLPPLTIQYADFALWQRAWLKDETLKSQLTYWEKQLKGLPDMLRLPTYRPRPAVQNFNGAFQEQFFPADLYKSLKMLSQREGVTIFMTLLAAFKILLYRYTGQEDIVVGSPVANRNREELEGLIGFFVNTIVLRTQLSDNINFRQMLSRIRKMALEAYAHQHLPFEILVEHLQPQRNMSQTPLFQVMFALQKSQKQDIKLDNLVLRPIKINTGTAKFDLSLYLIDKPDGLQMSLEYNTDLFNSSTIQQMLSSYHILLEGIVSNPNCRISKLPLLTEKKRQEVLVNWGRRQTAYPRQSSIQKLFEFQAQRDPKAVAVVFKDHQLTYGKLNERANKLAQWLIQQGIGPDCLVGLCMNRSLEMIIGMLGILKAGGAYVPLDPGYPTERLSFIVEDTQLPILLTQAAYVELLPNHKAKILCLDTHWSELEGLSIINPPPRAKAENLAYVMYTSGSTGKPKGVEVMHRGVMRLVCKTDYVHLSAKDRMAHISNCSFDAATFEVWGALLSGARLVVLDQETVLSPQALADRLQEEQINVMFLTTALFNLLAKESPKALAGLGNLLFGGEAVDPQWVRQVLNEAGPGRVLHVYGPTENTTFTTWHQVSSVPEEAVTIPIGRPIANTQVYVLDSRMEPVPVGVAGELYVGGDGLARGYLNQPQLTSQRFVDDPFSKEAGSRLYRTGDLVRWREDGNIEFLGRLDNQVKLRGFRIELGEIESVLRQHELVEEAVVLLREDEPGDKHLVGYVMGRAKESLSFEDIRVHLRKKLPDYMVPSYFVQLESLPLTSNGKVDRKALPLPEKYSTDLLSQFVNPRTPIEQALVEIWSDVLRRDSIGIHDNFFRIGGHSLLATQVISRISESLGVSMPVAELFEHPILDEFANELKLRMRRQEKFEQVPKIKRIENKIDIPLSFAQQRLWFINQLDPESPSYNIPLAIELKGELDKESLEKSFNELIRRHESLRSRFELKKGKPILLIDAPQWISIPIIDLSELTSSDSETEAHRLMTEESLRSFDLKHGPLLRVQLLRILDADHILLLTMHHIISDGWSMGIFFHELTALYESYSNGRPSPLPELPIQYADFAVWQRQWLSGQVLASQLDYWKEQLSDDLSVLDLPSDYPRPSIQTFNGALQSIKLSKKLSESLKSLSQREHVTLFMSLLSAFKVLLHRYTGQEDIIVGSPVANRSRNEIEGLIGFFVNMLVLRSQVSDTLSFRKFLAQVRETTLGAYSHQDLPFEKLVDEFEADRDPSRSPLFQVIFSLQNAPIEPLKLVGLQIKQIEMDCQTTHFELEVHVGERGGQLRITFIYNRDLFAPSTIERMMNHYQKLLEGVVSNPDCRISDLPMLSESERQELLGSWNKTKMDYPRHASIQELFELQVKRAPEAVAVVFKDKQLNYGQLNERANQLAHWLIQHNINPGCLIGLCMRRGMEIIISILGILKAGCAYLPLDPSYPKERLSFMMEDTQLPVLLTQSALVKELPAHRAQILCLDTQWSELEGLSTINPTPCVKAEDLAYIMYTSGSTGRPKGVEVRHKGVLRLLFGVDYVSLGPEENLLQLAPISFDASTFEIWGALLHGGRCVISPSQAPSIEELGEVIDRYGVSTLWLTASLFNLIINESPQILRGVKQLLTGGEALSVPHIRQALEHLPMTQLINGYGPTESTTFTCCYPIPKQLPEGLHSIPIGRPIANTRVYVLDGQMEPVPVGVPGELYIGGDGLARGYLNRPELTAERFGDDPFSKEADSRLYRTGDLVRWLSDGILEFLGRKDNQVKLRGFRIELGEIESILRDHELVQEAVVLLREDEPGDKRLAGYLVGREKESLSFEDIRVYLRKKLPDYMVPSYFVQLKSLPLTPNGKLDQRALPIPDISRVEKGKDYVAPTTPMEKELAIIWQEVLRVEHIGVYDNFFDLGGNSLMAMEVVAKIEEKTNFRINPMELIMQNLGQLAAIYERHYKDKPKTRPQKNKMNILSFVKKINWLVKFFYSPNSTFDD